MQGKYQYLAPSGLVVVVDYTADQNGFRPKIKFSGAQGAGPTTVRPSPPTTFRPEPPKTYPPVLEISPDLVESLVIGG